MSERNGWICLHRKFLDWEWYTDVSVAHLFLYCILRANYADTEWRGIKIKKGAFLTSYENLAKSTGLTIQQCRTALKKLKSTGEVTHKTTRRYSIITVNNWNLYQQINMQLDKLSTNYQQTNNKQVTTDNNNNNNNNINNNNNSFLGGKTDPYINKTNSIFIDEYQKVFNSKPYLMANQRNKLAELSAEVENFTDTIPTVLEKLKNIEFSLPNFTANYIWLLTDDNYIKVLSGTYDKKKTKAEIEWEAYCEEKKRNDPYA